MDIVYFTVIAIGLYFGADALLDWIERKRGARFENRQVVFFAIILSLALLTFWLVRSFSGPAAG
jgi:predicted PurR-regulated permease PerM